MPDLVQQHWELELVTESQLGEVQMKLSKGKRARPQKYTIQKHMLDMSNSEFLYNTMYFLQKDDTMSSL